MDAKARVLRLREKMERLPEAGEQVAKRIMDEVLMSDGVDDIVEELMFDLEAPDLFEEDPEATIRLEEYYQLIVWRNAWVALGRLIDDAERKQLTLNP